MIEAVVRVRGCVEVRGFVDVWRVGKRRITMWVAIYMAVKQLPIVVVRITVVVWSVAIWLIDMWIRIVMWIRIFMRIRIHMRITVDVHFWSVDM